MKRTVLLIALSLQFSGCSSFILRAGIKAIAHSGDPIASVERLSDPVLQHVGLSVLWIGHASMLIQIDDKIIITDPSFTRSVGMFSRRLYEPGIDPATLERIDITLISHLHFDHFAFGSLDVLPKNGTLIIPPGGAEYTPEMGFANTIEAETWRAIDIDGVRITPVPAKHFGGRYGLDMAWATDGFTGYIIEYHDKIVFFAGDTGYDPDYFKEIGKRFHIDLALIPIAPIEPHDFMKRVHADPEEALHIFTDVGAKWMVPIHHHTFDQGLDSSPEFAQKQMMKLIDERKLAGRVTVLGIGERKVFVE